MEIKQTEIKIEHPFYPDKTFLKYENNANPELDKCIKEKNIHDGVGNVSKTDHVQVCYD